MRAFVRLRPFSADLVVDGEIVHSKPVGDPLAQLVALARRPLPALDEPDEFEVHQGKVRRITAAE